MFATTVDSTANRFESLEMMAPGPQLATALAGVDRDALSCDELVSVLIAHRRLASHYGAEGYTDMAAIESTMRQHGLDSVAAGENTAAEIGAALRLTRRSADRETLFALALRQHPVVHEALARGDIDVRRARVLVQGTEHVPLAAAQEVIDQVIDDAPNLTSGQLAARLRRLCMEIDPDSAAERYRRNLDKRRVYGSANPEGTANLLALDLPPDRVAAFTRYLNDAARGLRGGVETRTMDQLRADVFLDILEGTHTRVAGKPAGGGVLMEVDLATLAGLNSSPGEIAGYGPVVADVARQVADEQQNSQWTFIVTDPETGDIVHTGTTRRRPTVRQRRHITSRYRRCVWPGCRMPSVDCDIDHRLPHADGGCTHNHNLAPVCRHHHRIRHQARWSYRRFRNGDHEWRSPLGRTYITTGRSP
ncbi:MAG: DUF222 domain-containing protein [bacterium]|nr:DUF222 domain-containing protein [bacterium]